VVPMAHLQVLGILKNHITYSPRRPAHGLPYMLTYALIGKNSTAQIREYGI
jgi:hypothetical protein